MILARGFQTLFSWIDWTIVAILHLGQTSPMVLAGPDRARQIQIVPRQFWTHFCMFWHAFDVFFRTYFSTWFRDRSNEILMKSDEIFYEI